MVEVINLTKTYRSGRGRITALEAVSFRIPRGVAAAVAGTSGSGKTTLLNCIGGLERPDAGHVLCFGKEIGLFSAKRLGRFNRHEVGFIFQHGNLLSYLSVFQNIAFPLVLNGIGRTEISNRVGHLLERIGLSEAGEAMPRELSGGEMQRVAAARALAHSPRLLLADEPTASLDSDTALNLIRLLLEMAHEKKCTLVIATHDPDIFRSADRILHLKNGRIIQQETP